MVIYTVRSVIVFSKNMTSWNQSRELDSSYLNSTRRSWHSSSLCVNSASIVREIYGHRYAMHSQSYARAFKKVVSEVWDRGCVVDRTGAASAIPNSDSWSPDLVYPLVDLLFLPPHPDSRTNFSSANMTPYYLSLNQAELLFFPAETESHVVQVVINTPRYTIPSLPGQGS